MLAWCSRQIESLAPEKNSKFFSSTTGSTLSQRNSSFGNNLHQLWECQNDSLGDPKLAVNATPRGWPWVLLWNFKLCPASGAITERSSMNNDYWALWGSNFPSREISCILYSLRTIQIVTHFLGSYVRGRVERVASICSLLRPLVGVAVYLRHCGVTTDSLPRNARRTKRSETRELPKIPTEPLLLSWLGKRIWN